MKTPRMVLHCCALAAALALVLVLMTGCGHKKVVAQIPAPPPNTLPAPGAPATSEGSSGLPSAKTAPEPGTLDHDYAAMRPLYTETGVASWYGTVYHHKRAANGEIYDQDGLTAAHKTLPLNSVARITDLANGKSVIVRITDRGPFVGDRVVDLSLAAAKAIGVYLPGTARVRIDVLETPKDIASGGRWCVQIGAFSDFDTAAALKEKLSKRYQSARVLQFTGPTGEWLRVRVAQDDKQRAYELARETSSPEGGVFVVRLD